MGVTTDGNVPRTIDRASASDRAFLAMDTGAVPEQFAVVLLLDDAIDLDLDRTRALVARRVEAVPRLRQKLVRAPVGCGGPIWVDDPDFDIRNHVRARACPPPGDEQAWLEAALAVVTTPLPCSAPLWSAVLLTGLADGRVALVLVLHHVLADGVGGLTVLANLVDPGPDAALREFPRPRPPARLLARDAWRARLHGLRRVPDTWRLLRRSMAAGGGVSPVAATPCSLVQHTGPRRRMVAVGADASAVRAAAHRYGATTNDAVLVAIAGALRLTLLARGEQMDAFAVAVPVSGRSSGDAPELGNMVSPLLVSVPATGDPAHRLAQVAATVQARKAAATGPPPIAVLGPLFRALAALGGYHWYMNHQHRLHTLVSHVRGPEEPVSFGGYRIGRAVPVGVAEGGNLTVYFEVLTYHGMLTITAIIDPDHFPDLETLADGLRTELELVVHAGAAPAGR
jgi:diacylglycerol O-acyltransferase / wax synthase